MSDRFNNLRGRISDSTLSLANSWADLLYSKYADSGTRPEIFDFSESQIEFLSDIGTASADLLFALAAVDYNFNLVVPALFGDEGLAQLRSAPLLGESRSALSLSFFIRQVLDAFLDCVWGGRDIPARILARTIAEACDILILATLDPNVSEDFAASSSEPDVFYKKHVARGNLPRRRRELLTERFGQEVATDIENYSGTEFQAFSQAVHPSYTAGVMLILGTFPIGDADPFSFVSGWPCARSVRYVLYTVSLALSIVSQEHNSNELSGSVPIISHWTIINNGSILGLAVATKLFHQLDDKAAASQNNTDAP